MATITVYKMGQSTQIQDFDLSAYKKMGWSTSSSGGSTPAPAVAPAASAAKSVSPPSGATLVSSPSQLSGLTEAQIWRDPNSSKIYKLSGSVAPTTATKATSTPAPAPTPSAPVAKTATSNATPPAGATLISSPSELSKYTEGQLWRDPNSSKIYALAGSASKATPTPVQSTQSTPVATATPTATPVTTPQASGQLNTVGLIEAYARKQAGTANATDLANLEYAQKNGWTPPSNGKTADQTSTGTANTNDIPGLNTNGLAEAYARKVAGTANAKDLENLDYAMSKGWTPNGDLNAPVTEAQKANDIINAQQDADINAKNGANEPATRKTVEDIMAEIKKTVTPDVAPPEAPDYAKSLTDLRTEYGIDPLETNLNDLNSQLQDLYAIRAQRIAAEKGKTVAMNVIEGRVSEVTAQENARITELENSINNVTNQLNTKYNVVNSIMSAKELDYNTASKAYDAQMTENISLFNAAQGIEESLKTEEQRAVDSARSSAQILVNGFMTAGMTFADLTSAQQTQLTQLSLQSGFGADFYSTVMSVTAEVQKDVLTSVISDDKAYATIIYKDGTTATIPTGQPRSSNVPAGGNPPSPTVTEDKEIAKFRSDAADLIEKLDGGDISWGTAWDQMHIKYPSASPQLIDQALGGGYDPSQAGANDQGYYGRGTKVAK